MRPDDLDAIFDGALFGPPTLEAVQAEEVAGGAVAAPVPVGAMDWYMERNEQPAGPFRLERLRELWHQGEFDPDTLFWCEAWTNWRPLSHVPELVAAMTISGLPTVAADASVSSASARAKEPGSEKKVVSALHSLVQQEETWLRKQEEEKEQAKEEARLALLDAPSAPVPVAPVAPVVQVAAPPMQPVVAPVATGGLLGPIPVPPPQAGVPVAPYPGLPMAPPLVPAMMAVPVPPEAFAPVRRGRMFLAGALIGSAVAGVIVGAMLLLPQVRRAPEQVTVAAPQPIPAPVEAAQPSAPVVAQTAPPAPAPAPVVAAAPVVQPAAPAVQPAAPVAQPPAPQPEVVASKVVAAPAQHEKSKSVVVAASASEERGAGPASQRRQQPPPAPVAPVSTEPRTAVKDNPPAVDPTNFDDSIDKEFERELGFAKGAPKHTPEDPRSSRSVYVPPEPGKDVPDSLATSDIVQVVSSHKEAILACIDTHEPERMSDSGKDRFVVRWRVQPSGSATDVAMETEALKGTPFARCIEGQVRSWKFPQHRVQSREPVRFPFTY